MQIQAVRDLITLLCHEPWFVTAREGDGCIVVVASRVPHRRDSRKVPSTFAGYAVTVEYAHGKEKP